MRAAPGYNSPPSGLGPLGGGGPGHETKVHLAGGIAAPRVRREDVAKFYTSATLDEGERFMTRRLASLILCGGVVVLGSACATKSFVQKQVSATESKLTQQMTATETNLTQQMTATETNLTERAGESRQAIDVADQRLNGLDLRVGEVGARASSAETRADLATGVARDAEARLSQRLASRNKHRLLETKFVYFDSGQTEIRSQDVNELEYVAKALTADPNAILELQGFADSRGSDRYNRELARERVEAVMRYLVQRHGIELRQLRAISMGKVALGAGEKASPEVLARARRVDIRLLAPWSSWEDAQSQIDPTAPEQTVTTGDRR
jgi:outer membrane protein OmpA-like peptidoglycan-associated protein